MEHPERVFYFMLAERLGCTVNELLMNISSYEITEWKAYFTWKNKEEEKEMSKIDKKKGVGNKGKPKRNSFRRK